MTDTPVASCERCPHACTRAVATRGPVPARLLFLSGAPRYHEEQQGLAFASPAFAWLEETLAAAGLDPSAVHYATLIGCRPPYQRPMRPEEITACAPRLERTINAVAPEVTVLCGHDVLAALLPGTPLGASHGQLVTRGRRRYLPLRHPYAALHNERYVDEVRADLRRLATLLREGLPALEASPESSVIASDSSTEGEALAGDGMAPRGRVAASSTEAAAPSPEVELQQDTGAAPALLARVHGTTGVPEHEDPPWQRDQDAADAPEQEGPAQLSLF